MLQFSILNMLPTYNKQKNWEQHFHHGHDLSNDTSKGNLFKCNTQSISFFKT